MILSTVTQLPLVHSGNGVENVIASYGKNLTSLPDTGLVHSYWHQHPVSLDEIVGCSQCLAFAFHQS